MKTTIQKLSLFLFTFTFSLLTAYAQAPESFKYQSVVRDASGNVITDQNIGVQIEILQGNASGTTVYKETHNETTNEFGLITLNIGEGNVQTGNFSNIDWASDTYFIRISMDVSGGTNYTEFGTTQLHAVPYSLHAKTSES